MVVQVFDAADELVHEVPVVRVGERLGRLDDAVEIKVNDFFNFRCWDEYIDFMCYIRKNPIRKPSKSILFASTYNRVAEEDDEER